MKRAFPLALIALGIMVFVVVGTALAGVLPEVKIGGNGYQCLGAEPNRWKIESGNYADLPDGYEIASVVVKAGQNCVPVYPTNDAPTCYSVSIVGNAVTVTKIGTGNGCQDISHLEGTYTVVNTPTPTNTPETPTPTNTPETPTPTNTPETPTPTGTPETPTLTPTPEDGTPTPTPTPRVCDLKPLYYQFTLTHEGKTCYLVSWDRKDEVGAPNEFWIPNITRQLCGCGWIAENAGYAGWVYQDTCTGEYIYNGKSWSHYDKTLETPHWDGQCAMGGC